MRQFYLAATAALCTVVSASFAQSSDLEKKDALPVTLLSSKSYSATSVDVSRLSTPTPGKAYTLEVKARYLSGNGRGLDVMANDATGLGFRVSMDATSLNWTNPLTTSSTLSASDNSKLRTLRFAVKDGNVNIYEDGYFVATRPIEIINESIRQTLGEDINPEVVPASWSGTKPTPQSKGWYIVNNGTEVNSWPNARYENDNNRFAMKDPDGSAYSGSFFFIRWDSNNIKTYKYAYPVELEANSTYEFSMDAAFWDNNGALNITTQVYSDKMLTSNVLGSHVFKTSNSSTGKRLFYADKFQFTTTKAGTYYIALSSGWTMYAIKNLQLHKVKKDVTPGILIGKDYEGEANLSVESATYDETGAYAPTTLIGEPSIVNYSNAGDVKRGFFFNTTATVSGKTNMHLTAEQTPFEGSTIDLQGDDAWLYFDYIKPSRVINNWLKSVKIGGAKAEDGVNCRVTMWANGAVIIPNGPAYDKCALTAYKGENFTGDTKEFEINTYHNNLGTWDNSIRSFKLKKGYMATLANNANGTGYSRVFIAADEDLEVPVMPEGMEKFVSFVRVFRWNYTSKKGKANGYGEKDILNITCNYDWNVGGKSDDPDVEYSPIRQNLGWPSWNDINSKSGVTHLLGCNEPDRPDQANASVDAVIEMWPEMLKSGLRLGSPAPSSVWVWNGDFFNLIEQLGYRCDFAVAHIYEENKNGASLVDRIKTLSNKGKGRPVWITEWNNGANWTNEYWPTAKGPKCDANSNIIYNEDGSTTEITRPLSKANAEKQRQFMAEALPALDKCDLLERYFEYDWVQDCRALVLGGELTPAGKVYGDHKAALSYHKMERPWEEWKICPPFPIMDIDNDYRNITVRWYDHNGETGKKYILERRMDDETDFTTCREFILGTDYEAGATVKFTEAIPCISKVEYRIKAISYKDTESIYSRVKTFVRDAAIAAPTLKGEAISTKIIKLTWNNVDGAKAYRIERSVKNTEGFEVVADNLNKTEWQDVNLQPNTTYFYRAYSLNSAAERPVSEVVEVKTKAFGIPEDMHQVRISAGSGSASLRWAFAYDTFYRIMRADKSDGEFNVIAEKVDATSFIDSNLKNGQTYFYKVQPWNEAGSGNETTVLEATPQAGKYLHLAFDENEGSVSYDEWGPYDGTFLNSTVFTEGRNCGYAAKLTKNSKSYIDLGKGTVSRLEDFTIATWIKLPGGKGRVFDFGSGTGIFMIAAAGGSNMKYKITCAKGAFDFTVPMKWSTTEWNHVVITQQGAEMKVYLNGELAGEGDNAKLIYPKDMGETTQNWLGRSQWAQDAYCDHVYDDFRIYDRAISSDDVKTLYADGELTFNDSSTGIESFKKETSSVKGIYNLSGMKVNKSGKGFYIIDGKKKLLRSK